MKSMQSFRQDRRFDLCRLLKPAGKLLLPAALAGLMLSHPACVQGRWRGPDGNFLPFTSEAEVLDFLRQAEIVERKPPLLEGTSRLLKVRLAKDGVEAHAAFRTTDIEKTRHTIGERVYLDFHDSYIYECAAYEVSRLLGVANVPPCVVREVGNRRGSMQLWIENAMAESDRRRAGLEAPSAIGWRRQIQTLHLFDALIYNFDRNQGNILIDRDWKLWFIDNTRSFHKSSRVEKLERIVECERDVWQKLRALDRETLDRHLGDLIEGPRILFVLERRDALVGYLDHRIAELGEDAVLYSSPVP